MPGFSTRQLDLDVCGDAYRLQVLSDRQQFADPDGHAERAGVSSAQWPLFGQLWPAGLRLAEVMHDFDIEGKRILELGCGIGLASLVLKRRGADVVASDMHPLAESFLAYNAALNGLPMLHFRRVDWASRVPALGLFDVVIASDVIYEQAQVAMLADAIATYAGDTAEVVVTDPGRGHAARLTTALALHGFERAAPAARAAGAPHALQFRRLAVAA
ncbi:class I SAM-dependent methyltransferase [Cognatilysobacter segetis]|uniref:class I SAM-dependent methyltransferase n=1 Tax=Cognatilysobacter segetis TaxID=2492394 RepID=UPI00105C05B9|nr:methyltransferase domain-containing protein [Lysobacter segetis]